MVTSSSMIDSYRLVDFGVLPAFLVAVLLILVAPGPDMAFMVASGLNGGRRAATRAALGITTGVSVYVLLTAAGLGAALTAAPTAVNVIRLAGALYLVYLAWTTWRTAGSDVGHNGRAGHGVEHGVFRRGFLVNLANPKIVLFFTAFLPQFLGDVTGNPAVQLLMLGLVLQLLGLLVDLAVGYAAGTMRDRVLSRPPVRRALDRFSAGVYVSLAIVLLVEIAHDLKPVTPGDDG